MLFNGDIVRVASSGNTITDGKNDKKGASSPSSEPVSVTALKKIVGSFFGFSR